MLTPARGTQETPGARASVVSSGVGSPGMATDPALGRGALARGRTTEVCEEQSSRTRAGLRAMEWQSLHWPPGGGASVNSGVQWWILGRPSALPGAAPSAGTWLFCAQWLHHRDL